MFLIILNIILNILSPSSDLNEAVETLLSKKFAAYDRFEFELVKTPSMFSSFTLSNVDRVNVNGNIAYIPVEIVNRKTTTNTYLQAKIKLFKKSFVASRDIKVNEKLNSDDFTVSDVEVTNVRGSILSVNENLSKYKSTLSLKTGEVLCRESINNLPIILKNTFVNGYLQKGNVEININVEAKQDGAAEEIITVATKEKKQFKARVLDSNTVQILE